MIKRLVKTLMLENGKLFGTVGDQRVTLAYCEPRVEIYEHQQDIPVMNKRSYSVKKIHAAIVLCPTPETTRTVDAEYLSRISHFELSADTQRQDGIFEALRLDLSPLEIDLDGDWEFELVGSPELIRKLRTI